MKFSLPLFFFGLLCFSSCSSQPTSKTIPPYENIMAILDTVYQMEQTPIRQRDEMMDKFGAESDEAQEFQKIYKANHAVNEKKVKKIIDEYGWLGPDVIGEQGNQTLFLVIQHSDYEVRDHYLPTMRTAAKLGIMLPRHLGNIEDRTATDLNRLQVYGNQVKYYRETQTFDVWPIIDPANVDKRRAEIGLGPIAEHLKNRFKLDWDLEKQIQRTADFIAQQEEAKK